ALLGLDVRDHAFLGQDLLDGGPGLAILPNGSAVSDDRLLVGEDGGFGRPGCYARPGGAGLPAAACAALEARVQADLALSARMIEFDTVARTAASTSRSGLVSGSGIVRPGIGTVVR
ncbi:MAG TPA: hypothetical protein VD838_14450, partial [Anaeromyxobacteraceae bacterium]|nr:hypothetical protein [Anaeromyxobacteraceae bacterium]